MSASMNGGEWVGGWEMEHSQFTEQDKRRLEKLENIGEKMVDEVLKHSPLKRWWQLAFIFAVAVLACTPYMPRTRGGGMNEASYLFLIFTLLTMGTVALTLYWRSKVIERVNAEFLDTPHGIEYQRLVQLRRATVKNKNQDIGQ